MLKLLVPFMVLITNAQAKLFKSPVQVNFVVENFAKANYYNWSETTDIWSGKPNTVTGEGGLFDIGALMIRGTDDGRTFKWSKASIKEVHMCEIWLETEPNVSSVTYNLDTARKLPRSKEGEWNGTDLHVMCDGKKEVLYAAQSSVQTSAAQVSSPADQQPSNDTPPFKETLTVTFFGQPANVANPVWWRDATKYDIGATNTDHLAAGDIYSETAENAEYLGHMKFTHTPSAKRLYNYQVAPKSDEEPGRIKGCVFNVIADPSVLFGVAIDKIHYFVEGQWMGAMKSGKPVEIDQSKIKDLIQNSCKELSLEDGKAEKEKPLS